MLEHAHARHIAIRLQRDDGLLAVEVADDGIGFDPGIGGAGLAALTDRVEALGGSLEVETAP